MNVKQIKLYCIKDDYCLLDKYFREKQIFISAMPLSGFDLRPIQISDFDENDWNRVIVYKGKHTVEIEEIESAMSLEKIFTFLRGWSGENSIANTRRRCIRLEWGTDTAPCHYVMNRHFRFLPFDESGGASAGRRLGGRNRKTAIRGDGRIESPEELL